MKQAMAKIKTTEIKNVFIYISLLGYILLSSCMSGNKDPYLAKILEQAGDNKAELEKVLSHYSAPSDSLKYKAAVFLIKYMPGKYAKVFPEYNIYTPVFDTIEKLNKEYEKIYISNGEFYKYYKLSVYNYFVAKYQIKNSDELDYNVKEDLKTITADYLVENIDYAFKTWEFSWNKNLSFDDFCEFILPYRYGNEELTPWRKIYYEKNIQLLDSFKNEKDPVVVGMFLKGLHDVTRSEISGLKGLANAIHPLDLIRSNTITSCTDETGQVLLRLRSLGIPVARLSFPNWGNWGSGHDVNGILTLEKKWISFGGGTDSKAYLPPRQFTTAKLFVETYSDNKSSGFISSSNYDNNEYPYKDITSTITQTATVTIPFLKLKDGTKACLCVFNNSEWMPIIGATINKEAATFQQIGKNIIYMPGVIISGELQLGSYPFLLDSIGKVHLIEPSKENITLKLNRKYPPNESLNNLLPSLTGCYFEGSNDSTFINAVTLWKIEKLNSLHTIQKVLENAKFQYIRLVFPNIDRVNEGLGGIQIYGKSLSGRALLTGEPISSIKAPVTVYNRVFDNSPLTFVRLISEKATDFDRFDGENLIIPDKQFFWVGLKLKEPVDIETLEFSPRSDDNNVNKDETYELFYWDNGWVSLGTKLALANDELQYVAPRNAIYLLKNVDKGVENRIFLYKNNSQAWY